MVRVKGQIGHTILHSKCENCGADVHRKKGSENPHMFCSRECYWKSDFRSQLVANQNRQRNPEAQGTRPCANCGTPVTRYLSTRQKEFFCSRQCRWENRKKPHARRITASGYVLIYAGRDYPGTTKTGHILEHRKVMQDILGRPLLAVENIHHMNGVRDDNRPGNLELWTRSQPQGQRVKDKISWAREFLAFYEKE